MIEGKQRGDVIVTGMGLSQSSRLTNFIGLTVPLSAGFFEI